MNLFLFAKQFVDMLYPYQGLDYIMVFIALYMIGYQLILVRPNIVHKSTSQDYALALIAIILSVHFLKVEDKFYAVDGLESFEDLLKSVGTLSKVYDLYFDTLIKAIKSDLGEFKPRRIGHPTLVRIFNKKYPYNYENNKKIDEVLQAIKEANYEIDVNTAGLRKPYCGEVYPSGYFFNKAKELEIDMVFGSDSHKAEDIAANFNKDL